MRPLTFEHVPPRAAFNGGTVFLQGHEQLFESASYLYGKRKQSHRGMGEYSLCMSCQTNTGGWYAKHYVPFAHQAEALLRRSLNGDAAPHVFLIRPLEVLKQILVMFASAERSQILLQRPEYRGYLLDPLSTQFPRDIRVFMYYTVSSTHRFNGWAVIADGADRMYQCSEIAFHPIGLVLSFDSIPPHPSMVDITELSFSEPMEMKRVCLDPPILGVSSVYTGTYDSFANRMGHPLTP